MYAYTAAFRTFRALITEGTRITLFLRKMHHATRRKRHFLFCRTTNDLPLPVQMKLLFGKQLALSNRPSFTIDFKPLSAVPHQFTAQICSINMQFLQVYSLWHEIFADGFCDTGLRRVGGCDPDSSYHVSIQVMQDMTFVPIYKYTAALTSMTHLLIFNTNASVFCNTIYKRFLSVFILFNILLFHLLSCV